MAEMLTRRRWCLTLLSDHLPPGPLVLDASVVINLLGTGQPVEVLAGLRQRCLIEQKTLQEVKRHPIPGFNLEERLEVLCRDGLLEVARMTDAEYAVFIELVHAPLGVRLGDGESAAIAIAPRGAGIVLDEKRARRRVAETLPALATVSSLRLVLTSAHRQDWTESKAAELVALARLHSRMGVPREDAPLLEQLMSSNPTKFARAP